MPSEFMTVLWSFVFGTLIGSFLNVAIWRLPRGEKLGGRSACPRCGRVLGSKELIPVISFVWQNGKCRGCRDRISPRYPIIEILTGLLFAYTTWVFIPYLLVDYIWLLRALYIVSLCITIFVIDYEHYLILDRVIYPAYVLVLILNIIHSYATGTLQTMDGLFISGLLGALLGFAPFWAIWYLSKGKWMGFGDVKFAALIGLMMGVNRLPVAIFLGVFVGTIVSIILLLMGKKKMASAVPFGTFLAVGTMLALWWGPQILKAYLHLVWPS